MARPSINLIGVQFGNLKVISLKGRNLSGQQEWECLCDCGNIKIILQSNLTRSKSGTISCSDINCPFSKKVKQSRLTHGLTGTREHRLVMSIIDRCYNINCKDYNRYGGRGIKVFNEWYNDVGKFCDYIKNNMTETQIEFKNRTGEDPTLDRVDVNGNYEPGNLRWSTLHEQSQNMRVNVLTPDLVKVIRLEYSLLNSPEKVFDILVSKYSYVGALGTIKDVIYNKTWTNII